MIVRMWHGRVDSSKSDEYAEFMKQRAAPDYGSVDGLQKLLFLRRNDKDVTHFVLGAKGSKPGLARIFKEVDQRSLKQNRDGRELAV